jgi:hypothetical protein
MVLSLRIPDREVWRLVLPRVVEGYHECNFSFHKEGSVIMTSALGWGRGALNGSWSGLSWGCEEVKRSGREADHSSPSSTDDKSGTVGYFSHMA